jgi:predicted TIM-barrel fold metal-dependent hydrolase
MKTQYHSLAAFPVPRPVSAAVPPGATDCHMHVFEVRYPLSPKRTYTPAPAPLEQYRKVAAALGLTRAVVVQPSAYGTDNSCTLDAVESLGPSARAVVGLDLGLSDDELERLHKRGARGVRLNPASNGVRDLDAIASGLVATAKRIERLGWHLQIFTDVALIEQLANVLRTLPVPVVVDHMGLAMAAQGPSQRGLVALCELLAGGRVWVKLSGAYRISTQEPGFADASSIIRSLIAANPSRCIWGTDWPHTGAHAHTQSAEAPPVIYRPLDTAALLEQLISCAGEKRIVDKILVENPAALYGF